MIQTVAPYAEPLDLAEAKSHLRVEISDDDDLIRGLIRGAREWAEITTGLQLVTASWTFYLDRFPWSWSRLGRIPGRDFTLPRPPLLSIDQVQYVDTAGILQTWDPTLYQVDTIRRPGRLQPAYGQIWPVPRYQMNAVSVAFKAGFATPFTANPGTGVCTALGRTLAANEAVRLSNSGGALPAGLSAYTDYYAVSVSGSTFKLSLTPSGGAVAIGDTGTGTQFLGAVPENIRSALKLILGHYYEHRGDEGPTNPAEVPLGASVLLRGSWTGELGYDIPGQELG